MWILCRLQLKKIGQLVQYVLEHRVHKEVELSLKELGELYARAIGEIFKDLSL